MKFEHFSSEDIIMSNLTSLIHEVGFAAVLLARFHVVIFTNNLANVEICFL